jgi:hypothetical protein
VKYTMNEKPRCCVRVYGPGYTFKGSPCPKPVKVTVDGKHYCATHSPDAVAKRRAASDAKFNEALERGRRHAERANTERHKAACFDELVQALMDQTDAFEAAYSFIPDHERQRFATMMTNRGLTTHSQNARAALAKARNV